VLNDSNQVLRCIILTQRLKCSEKSNHKTVCSVNSYMKMFINQDIRKLVSVI